MKKILNRNELLDLMSDCKIVAEIGVFKGDFSRVINKKLSPTELHLIDKFEGVVCSGDKDGKNIIWADLTEEYQKLLNWGESNQNVKIHRGLSYEVMSQFKDNYFDLVYVDGDHDYLGVKKDLEISFLKIKNSGHLLGHDYTPEFMGVVKAVNEFCEEKKQEISIITEDGCPTFVIKIKK